MRGVADQERAPVREAVREGLAGRGLLDDQLAGRPRGSRGHRLQQLVLLVEVAEHDGDEDE